jgi:hypothetical protein
MSKHARSGTDEDANLQYSIKRMKLESNSANSTPYVVPTITSSSVSHRGCPISTGFCEYDHKIMNELLHILHDERVDRKQQKGSVVVDSQLSIHSTMDVDH